jgi:hypothetical protein
MSSAGCPKSYSFLDVIGVDQEVDRRIPAAVHLKDRTVPGARRLEAALCQARADGLASPSVFGHDVRVYQNCGLGQPLLATGRRRRPDLVELRNQRCCCIPPIVASVFFTTASRARARIALRTEWPQS